MSWWHLYKNVKLCFLLNRIWRMCAVNYIELISLFHFDKNPNYICEMRFVHYLRPNSYKGMVWWPIYKLTRPTQTLSYDGRFCFISILFNGSAKNFAYSWRNNDETSSKSANLLKPILIWTFNTPELSMRWTSL